MAIRHKIISLEIADAAATDNEVYSCHVQIQSPGVRVSRWPVKWLGLFLPDRNDTGASVWLPGASDPSHCASLAVKNIDGRSGEADSQAQRS